MLPGIAKPETCFPPRNIPAKNSIPKMITVNGHNEDQFTIFQNNWLASDKMPNAIKSVPPTNAAAFERSVFISNLLKVLLDLEAILLILYV